MQATDTQLGALGAAVSGGKGKGKTVPDIDTSELQSKESEAKASVAFTHSSF